MKVGLEEMAGSCKNNNINNNKKTGCQRRQMVKHTTLPNEEKTTPSRSNEKATCLAQLLEVALELDAALIELLNRERQHPLWREHRAYR